jgi:hypothetical protein
MSDVTLNKVNQDAADKVSAFLAKRPVAFVGAGMSKPAYLDWDELIDHLADKLKIARTGGIDNYSQAEVFYANASEAYRNELVAMFGGFPGSCRAGLREMVKLTFAAFITTNYDFSISRAFQEISPMPVVYNRYPAVEATDCRRPERRVFHVHGAVDDNKIDNLDHFILHRTAYYKAYFKEMGEGHGVLSSFFYNVFRDYPIFFVGFGLRKEEPLGQVLRIANDTREGSPQRLMLRPGPVSDAEKENYMLQYGIEVVPYDKLDDTHRGIDEIFLKLSQDRAFTVPQFTSSLAGMSRPVINLDQ